MILFSPITFEVGQPTLKKLKVTFLKSHKKEEEKDIIIMTVATIIDIFKLSKVLGLRSPQHQCHRPQYLSETELMSAF